MKLTIIGAGGVRTPLIVQAIYRRREQLGITDISLMDIDRERLELIGVLSSNIEDSAKNELRITHTTDAIEALTGADYVITTFRVGGIESRAIDERVPLNYGLLGQETTGPGGFAMGIRSIPVLLDYVKLMQKYCPDAWLINFANPAGMLTEAVVRFSGWNRIVGICDGPASMHELISTVLQADPDDVFLDYFGLNHLGWIKTVTLKNQDYLPYLIDLVKSLGDVPGLPFDAQLITEMGMIPNEYLYYYYYNTQAIKNILTAGESRGEQVARENLKLFADLREKYNLHDIVSMQSIYHSYQEKRSKSYMQKETGKVHDMVVLGEKLNITLATEGYAGVALGLIEGLSGHRPRVQILNIPNHGAIAGLEEQDVVEIPALVSHNHVQPVSVNNIPMHCMGLIQQVKQYERLTIEASVEKSYAKALLALTIHPLVRDYSLAKSILDEYIRQHKSYFPALV